MYPNMNYYSLFFVSNEWQTDVANFGKLLFHFITFDERIIAASLVYIMYMKVSPSLPLRHGLVPLTFEDVLWILWSNRLKEKERISLGYSELFVKLKFIWSWVSCFNVWCDCKWCIAIKTNHTMYSVCAMHWKCDVLMMIPTILSSSLLGYNFCT